MTFRYNPTSAIKKIGGSILALLITTGTPCAHAQAPITINSDNSVTITYIDPNAEEVKVQGTFLKKQFNHPHGWDVLKRRQSEDDR